MFLHLGNSKIVACGVEKFALDFTFKGRMPITKFGDMGLQSHVLPTFVSGVGNAKSMAYF